MRTLVVAAVLCLTASFALAQEANHSRRHYASSNMVGDKVEWRFVRWGDGILIDNVMINGKGPFRFVLDTGAEGAGRVDKKVAEALELPEAGSVKSSGLLGQMQSVTVRRLDSLAIGALTFTRVVMLSRDYNAERPRGLGPIDGILGFHLFNEYLLTINYPARTITITRGELTPPDGKNIVSIISDDEDPEIEVTIGGQTTKALIDTGAMTSLAVPAEFAKGLKFTSEPQITSWEGLTPIRSATLAGAVRLGEIEIANPKTVIAGPLKDANIGVEILAKLAVTFDQKNARIRFERPAERKRLGLSFAISTEGFPEFHGVEPGGVAATAGLRETDRVIGINGVVLTEMDREKLIQQLDLPTITLQIERDGARQEIRLSTE